MKLKRYFHNIITLTGYILLASTLLVSCNDDRDIIDNGGLPDESEKVTVSFVIPKATFGIGNSRAGEDDEDRIGNYPKNGEGAISNLYILSVQTAYFDDDDKVVDMTGVRNRVVITPINVLDFDGTIGSENNVYKLSLYPGTYRFYLFANCDLYSDNRYSANENFDENMIFNIYWNFASDTPLKPGHLPMACAPTQVEYDMVKTTVDDNGNKVTTVTRPRGLTLPESDTQKKYLDYSVPIKKSETTTIYANLEFMCAKVRYTILFDATQPTAENGFNGGVSDGFGNQSIRFYVDETGATNPWAENLRSTTYFYPEGKDASTLSDNDKNGKFMIPGNSGGADDNATWLIPLYRYNWPKAGVDYPLYPSQELDQWANSFDEWKASRKRAWQGVAYFPENNDPNMARTVLKFPYILDSYKEANQTETDPGHYVDGEYDPNNFKTLYLFGNNDETHYEGGKYYDEYGNPFLPANPGIVRGTFYDVVAIVENPDKWDLRVTVYGKIEKWHETDQNLQEETDGVIRGDNTDYNGKAGINANTKEWKDNIFTNEW